MAKNARKLNTSYDISEAFQTVENELIDSMIRNLNHHRAEELKEGYNWSQWQVEQLAALDEYKRRNMKKYKGIFGNINNQIDTLITMQRAAGNAEQEISILKAIKEGAKFQKTDKNIRTAGVFFKINDEKINSLIKATQDDFKKAETAILRMANDQYRKIIFNAQVYAMTGATYEKAVDMATKDFLSAGINCIEYSNGARHTMADYADMALRTAQKRAYLTGEGEKRMEWGISTVIMNKRGNPCPKCKPFVGKIFIDDVWSGGSKDGISETTGLKYPLISSAIKKGLYHPRCRDSHTTYFEGISTPPDDKYTKEELEELAENYNHEQRQQYAQRQAEKYGRLAKYSLDKENKRKYAEKEMIWNNQWENEIQEYRPVLRGDAIINIERGSKNINSSEMIGTINRIYVSNQVTLKRKQLHKIDISIAETLRKLGINEADNLPTILIISSDEMQTGALASYNPLKNVLYFNEKVGVKEFLLKLQKDCAAPDNELSTYIHEFLHWKDAEGYRKKYGKISSNGEYLEWIRKKSEKAIDKLNNKGYNINEISNYARECYKNNKYDEVFTEYRTKNILEGD